MKRGQHRAAAGGRHLRLFRQHQEARGVVRGVLDIALQNLEAVNLGGELRGDGRLGEIALRRNRARGPRRVGFDDGGQAQCADRGAALAQRMGVAVHGLHGLERGAGQRHELVGNPLEMLAHDVQAGIRQEVVHVGDAARDRILHRDHRIARSAVADGGDGVLEGRAGLRHQAFREIIAGDVRVGARLALIGNGSLRRLRFCLWRCHEKTCFVRAGGICTHLAGFTRFFKWHIVVAGAIPSSPYRTVIASPREAIQKRQARRVGVSLGRMAPETSRRVPRLAMTAGIIPAASDIIAPQKPFRSQNRRARPCCPRSSRARGTFGEAPPAWPGCRRS